jgi:SulP family sulfate permease
MLWSAFVVGAVLALRSSFKGTIAIPQDRIAPILAIMGANIVARMPNAIPEAQGLAVLAAIAMVSIITGVTLYWLGRFKLGNLIQYIPYPVVGGFLAGSGWLLIVGALRVMTGRAVNVHTLPALFDSTAVVKWLPGIAFGVLLFGLMRRWTHYLLMPIFLICAIGMFYLVLALAGSTPALARQNGLLPNFPEQMGLQHLSTLSAWLAAPWGVLYHELGVLATVLLTTVVSVLLTASALELAARQEIDLNQELRSAGVANVLSGLGGGMVGFHSLSLSRLVLSMGTSSRWVGAIAASLCGLALLVGPAIVGFIPQYVCGGLLFFLGLMFLWEWVFQARKTLTKVDYGVVILILAVVGAVGYAEGIATGIVAAIVLFLHNYSRVDVVTHALSGAQMSSNVDRPVRQLRLLRERADEICIFKLQGFIFFGTANHLLMVVRARAVESTRLPLRYVVMDFRRVTGLDSSAILSLCKVEQLAERLGFVLVMTQLNPEILMQIEVSGFRAHNKNSLITFPDLDHGLEWCENQILRGEDGALNGHSTNLAEQLNELWPTEMDAAHLLPYLERSEVPEGVHLIRQSDMADALYFIESGQVTVFLEFDDGRKLRLRSMGAGTVVGEIGVFLGGLRTASVVTDQACTCYSLSVQTLKRIERENPSLALAFHRFMVCLLAERLTNSSRTLRSILE